MENISSAQSPEKTNPEEYDLVILGGGTGSTIAAWTFAGQGQRVAAIDRKYVGGSCPNIARLPSKNIIHSAKVASYLRRSEEFGIVQAGGNRILGFTGFGVGVGEILSSVQIAMVAGLPHTVLRDALLTHPTLVEGLIPLFSSVPSVQKSAAAKS
jgi:pyruvate/2-oxoglutarate dehydrogenase complex dihydrolipoamide dehydrogenase (E3) component